MGEGWECAAWEAGRPANWRTMRGGLHDEGEVLKGGEARCAESLNVDLRGVEMTLKDLA